MRTVRKPVLATKKVGRQALGLTGQLGALTDLAGYHTLETGRTVKVRHYSNKTRLCRPVPRASCAGGHKGAGSGWKDGDVTRVAARRACGGLKGYPSTAPF